MFRMSRFEKYKPLLSENFEYYFVVDKGHEKGPEVHCINENGLIYVYNERTRKFITILHPRPKQLKRYFGGDIPEKVRHMIVDCNRRNKELNLNNE